MTLILQAVFANLRRVSFLFLLCGVAVYLIDYHGLKDKKKFEREAKFSRAVSFSYVVGCILVILGTWVGGRYL